MRVLFKRTSQVLEKLKPRVSIRRLTMSSKLHRKKKNCSDMVMNLMASSESARKRLRLLLILSIIWRWETRTIVISSCKELRELILKRRTFLKTSAELLLKISSKREETYRNFKRIMMMTPANWWSIKLNLKLSNAKMSKPKWSMTESMVIMIG